MWFKIVDIDKTVSFMHLLLYNEIWYCMTDLDDPLYPCLKIVIEFMFEIETCYIMQGVSV